MGYHAAMYELPDELKGRWNKTGHLLMWFFSQHRQGQKMSAQCLADDLEVQYDVLQNMLTGK